MDTEPYAKQWPTPPVAPPPSNGWRPTTSTGLGGATAAVMFGVFVLVRKFAHIEFTGEEAAAIVGAVVVIVQYLHPDGGRK